MRNTHGSFSGIRYIIDENVDLFTSRNEKST